MISIFVNILDFDDYILFKQSHPAAPLGENPSQTRLYRGTDCLYDPVCQFTLTNNHECRSMCNECGCGHHNWIEIYIVHICCCSTDSQESLEEID